MKRIDSKRELTLASRCDIGSGSGSSPRARMSVWATVILFAFLGPAAAQRAPQQVDVCAAKNSYEAAETQYLEVSRENMPEKGRPNYSPSEKLKMNERRARLYKECGPVDPAKVSAKFAELHTNREKVLREMRNLGADLEEAELEVKNALASKKPEAERKVESVKQKLHNAEHELASIDRLRECIVDLSDLQSKLDNIKAWEQYDKPRPKDDAARKKRDEALQTYDAAREAALKEVQGAKIDADPATVASRLEEQKRSLKSAIKQKYTEKGLEIKRGYDDQTWNQIRAKIKEQLIQQANAELQASFGHFKESEAARLQAEKTRLLRLKCLPEVAQVIEELGLRISSLRGESAAIGFDPRSDLGAPILIDVPESVKQTTRAPATDVVSVAGRWKEGAYGIIVNCTQTGNSVKCSCDYDWDGQRAHQEITGTVTGSSIETTHTITYARSPAEVQRYTGSIRSANGVATAIIWRNNDTWGRLP